MNLFDLFVKIGIDDKASPAMKGTQKNSETLTNKIKVMSEQFDAAQKNVDKLAQEFNTSVANTGAASKETQELAKKLDEAEKEAERAKTALDGYNKELESTENAASNSADKLSYFSEKLGSGLATAAKVGTAAIGAASTAIVALGKIGLDYNSQMEQYTTNFTTMLGSQEAAVQKVEELKKFAASTPLSMDDLAKGTQTLLAFGVESEKSTGILRQLGDIALGDADKMQRLATAFGKATASGKVTGDTVQQMIDAGWNPLIQISKAAGETMEETQKRMSAGAVSVEELQAAMEAVTTGTGQFAGGMEAASHTTQGLISTLQDNVKSKIGEAFQSVSDILQSEVLPRAIEFVNSINVDSIIENVNGLVSTFIELSPVIAAATAATLAYKAAVSISEVIDAAKKATEGQTIAQAALNAVMNANPFALVATLIAAVGTALVTLYMTNEDFRNKVNAAWGTVKDTISNVVSALKTFFTETLPGAIDTALDWLETLPDKFREVGANLLEGLWNGITDKVEWLKGKVSGVVDTIKGWFTSKEGFDEHSPSKWAKKVFQYVMEGGGEGLDAGLPGLMQSVGSVTDRVKSGLDFGTASVDFAYSGMGMSSAGIINSTASNNYSNSNFPSSIELRLSSSDGQTLGRWLVPFVRSENRSNPEVVSDI